jgi:hypothetical protein
VRILKSGNADMNPNGLQLDPATMLIKGITDQAIAV